MKDEQWVEAVEDNWPKLRYMEAEMEDKVKIMMTDKIFERIEYIRESSGMTRKLSFEKMERSGPSESIVY